MDSTNILVNLDKKEVINQINKLSILDNIKSIYILKLLFNNFKKSKHYEIIKYNKRIQKKFNLNIHNFKEYSEKLTPIEIDIIPVENIKSKYINIKKKDELYYHIYFNNSYEEEIKRYYIEKSDKINNIKIIIDYQILSFNKLFKDCNCIGSIYFKKFYRNNITDMSYMFFGCSLLKEINLYSFNTTNVIDMRNMFSGCTSLKELNLSNFNTNNVINMYSMFFKCSSLKELNISNFNFSKTVYMRCMFSFCSSLKELNISNFNIDNDTLINHIFFGISEELEMKLRKKYKNIKEEAFDRLFIL